MNNKNQHIAVLMGGWNNEKEVSIVSGEAVYQALVTLGYKATKINFQRDIVKQLEEVKPDVVFNALHGRFGEDGKIQGLLDILNIPYTHSGTLASALCMDKVLTREICATVGVKYPKFRLLTKGEDVNNEKIIKEIGKPFVVKPINEGSSVDIEVILEDMEFNLANYNWHSNKQIIIEKYIAGQELDIAIMGDKALGVIEVRPTELFYNYKCKYTAGMTNYVMPAEISAEKYAEALDLALRCHKITGCSDVSRVEFILNNKNGGDNQLYLLEVNTHPGFTPNSLLPKIAKYVGISFEEIVQYLVENAACNK